MFNCDRPVSGTVEHPATSIKAPVVSTAKSKILFKINFMAE